MFASEPLPSGTIMHTNLWALLSGKTFTAITLTLSSLSLCFNRGWLSPADWFTGIVQGYKAVTKSITDLLFQWVPVDGWHISQTESDDLWLASITIIPPGVAALRSKRTGLIIYLGRGAFLLLLLFGLPSMIISSGIEDKTGSILNYMDTTLEYIHFGASTSVYIGFAAWLSSKSALDYLKFLSQYIAFFLIIWALYLTGAFSAS